MPMAIIVLKSTSVLWCGLRHPRATSPGVCFTGLGYRQIRIHRVYAYRHQLPYYSHFIGRNEPRRAYRHTCQSNVQSCRFITSPTTCHHSIPDTRNEGGGSAIVRIFDGILPHGLAMVPGRCYEAHVTFHHSASQHTI